jgi:hypothetical protein
VRRSRSGRAVKDSVLCVHEGCMRYKQTGCSGYCCTHSHTIQHYRDMRKDRKNGLENSANQSIDVSPQAQIEEATSTKSPAEKKVKLSDEVASPKSPAFFEPQLPRPKIPVVSRSPCKLVGQGKNSPKSADSNIRRSWSGRAANKTPKVRHHNDDSDFSPEGYMSHPI